MTPNPLNSEAQSQSPMQIDSGTLLAGGRELSIQYLDGRAGTVLVRLLPIREYPKLWSAANDEARQAEIYAGKETGWAETLAPASHDLIMETGDALNQETFFKWAARRVKTTKALAPQVVQEAVENAVSKALRDGSAKLRASAD